MIEKNKLNWNPALEDIHTHVEFELKRKIGDLAKKFIWEGQEMIRL
ncbi:MAG: hypothetical protein CM15mP93_02970 [Thiotrichaceae bacterium]|nr:MAG: hypothetical protein CM15mP93_02970 [Thiotrichaceae bacterium]